MKQDLLLWSLKVTTSFKATGWCSRGTLDSVNPLRRWPLLLVIGGRNWGSFWAPLLLSLGARSPGSFRDGAAVGRSAHPPECLSDRTKPLPGSSGMLGAQNPAQQDPPPAALRTTGACSLWTMHVSHPFSLSWLTRVTPSGSCKFPFPHLPGPMLPVTFPKAVKPRMSAFCSPNNRSRGYQDLPSSPGTGDYTHFFFFPRINPQNLPNLKSK